MLDISEHLTGNGAQVVQYVSRSSRLDGFCKGTFDDRIDDLTKAIRLLHREIARVKAEKAQAIKDSEDLPPF